MRTSRFRQCQQLVSTLLLNNFIASDQEIAGHFSEPFSPSCALIEGRSKLVVQDHDGAKSFPSAITYRILFQRVRKVIGPVDIQPEVAKYLQ